jgi:hypothetical protein
VRPQKPEPLSSDTRHPFFIACIVFDIGNSETITRVVTRLEDEEMLENDVLGDDKNAEFERYQKGFQPKSRTCKP